MDAIAVAAKVSKPTLYRYYQNKEHTHETTAV
jgi:AcrR family transcriptional regulator